MLMLASEHGNLSLTVPCLLRPPTKYCELRFGQASAPSARCTRTACSDSARGWDWDKACTCSSAPGELEGRPMRHERVCRAHAPLSIPPRQPCRSRKWPGCAAAQSCPSPPAARLSARAPAHRSKTSLQPNAIVMMLTPVGACPSPLLLHACGCPKTLQKHPV